MAAAAGPAALSWELVALGSSSVLRSWRPEGETVLSITALSKAPVWCCAAQPCAVCVGYTLSGAG